MNWTEITLSGIQPLLIGGKQVGTIERRETADRIDSLAVRFDAGPHVELSAVVDVSEQLRCPRVFVVEGVPRDTFLLIGGEKVYWLTIGGAVEAESSLFRRWGEEEYWTTRIIEYSGVIVVVYEAGVMAIAPTLELRWHMPKLFNDNFVAVEGNVLRFLRDNGTEWFMRIEDGVLLK